MNMPSLDQSIKQVANQCVLKHVRRSSATDAFLAIFQRPTLQEKVDCLKK